MRNPARRALRSAAAVSTGASKSSMRPQARQMRWSAPSCCRSWIRKRYQRVSVRQSLVQVTLGGVLVAAVGIVLGHA